MRVRIARLVLILALGLLVGPLAADAQQPKKVARIGFLQPGPLPGPLLDAFRQGLRDLGYVEGLNLVIEYRSAEGSAERLPALAAELVSLNVDIILAPGTPAALAAKHATTTIPIVMPAVGDPVESGLVASLARPGGNITGLSHGSVDISVKWLELLKEAVPKVSRMAILWTPTNPVHANFWRELRVAAPRLGVTLQSLEVRDPNEFESAFAAMTRERAGALVVMPDTFFRIHRKRVAELAVKNRLPTMFETREYMDAGGLMAYGAPLTDLYRRSASFVDKILKGTKPADLPVEQPTKFELVINLKTAKALGLTIPQAVLIRADEVIQ